MSDKKSTASFPSASGVVPNRILTYVLYCYLWAITQDLGIIALFLVQREPFCNWLLDLNKTTSTALGFVTDDKLHNKT